MYGFANPRDLPEPTPASTGTRTRIKGMGFDGYGYGLPKKTHGLPVLLTSPIMLGTRDYYRPCSWYGSHKHIFETLTIASGKHGKNLNRLNLDLVCLLLAKHK